MPKKALLAAFLFFVVTVLSGSVRADVITMNNGQVHEGKITAEEQDRVQIKLEDSGVRLWFSRDQILSVEKTESDEDPEKEKAEPESNEETPIALDDDVARAKEMLDKMREQAKNEPPVIKKKNRTSSTKPPPPSSTKTKAKPKAKPTLSDDEIDKLIHALRSGKDVYVRLGACKKLGEFGATEATPDLIQALYDETPLIRKAANESLIKITGQNFGYNPHAQGSVRDWAIKKWEDWYDDIKKKEAKEQLKSLF